MNYLHEGARPEERFHVQFTQPAPRAWGWDWACRRVDWDHLDRGKFHSYIFLWFIRWYRGTVKCDGTRTYAWQATHPGEYVMTTTPKEMASFRLSYKKPDRERWDNMGGI